MILCRFITVEQFPFQNANVPSNIIFFLKGCGCNGNPNIVDFFFRNDGFPAAAFYLETEIWCFYTFFSAISVFFRSSGVIGNTSI